MRAGRFDRPNPRTLDHVEDVRELAAQKKTTVASLRRPGADVGNVAFGTTKDDAA
jgi:hypothetical protein